MVRNKTLIYKRYAPLEPVPGENLAVEDLPFDPAAAPPPGGITVKNTFLSLDPYQRGQMRRAGDPGTYSVPWVEGRPAVVTALSTVLRSDHRAFRAGDQIIGFADAGEYATIPAELLAAGTTRAVPSELPAGIAQDALVGALGIPGLAAYVSFFEYVPAPRAGKTMLVSAASGAVGQIVGQLGKMHGMKVIGSTGSPEKVEFVTRELGFDGAWDYRTETTAAALDRLAPEGLDVDYENVGGEMLETALLHMKDFGTIIASGMVSEYNVPDQDKYGVKTLMNIVLKRLSVHGFICGDPHHVQKYGPTFTRDMLTWISEGKIKTRNEVVEGLDSAPDAFIRMLRGDKLGKMVLKVT
ncbi:Zinc-type alcohol dehydrogenase-like protein PB24D3.08c [Apiospora saccharicola]|uniref:Zinc-type alcohol dehydrogenase-like protein PB24D3.08c n=1 Tax=Apiospora saccharicola TaxID=335842 RepID=A0ABR1VN89_9PEZI